MKVQHTRRRPVYRYRGQIHKIFEGSYLLITHRGRRLFAYALDDGRSYYQIPARGCYQLDNDQIWPLDQGDRAAKTPAFRATSLAVPEDIEKFVSDQLAKKSSVASIFLRTGLVFLLWLTVAWLGICAVSILLRDLRLTLVISGIFALVLLVQRKRLSAAVILLILFFLGIISFYGWHFFTLFDFSTRFMRIYQALLERLGEI